MTLLPLLNHLWQSTAVALAVLVLLFAFRGIPARTRRALCWLALAKFAVPLTLIAPFHLPLGALGRWLSLDSPTPLAARATLPTLNTGVFAPAVGAATSVASAAIPVRALSPT